MKLNYHVGWTVYNALITLRFQHVNSVLRCRDTLAGPRILALLSAQVLVFDASICTSRAAHRLRLLGEHGLAKNQERRSVTQTVTCRVNRYNALL